MKAVTYILASLAAGAILGLLAALFFLFLFSVPHHIAAAILALLCIVFAPLFWHEVRHW